MRHIPLIIFGVGGVGRALLQQIVDGRAVVAARAGCRFDVTAVADRKSCLWDPAGLRDAQLEEAIARKRKGDLVNYDGKQRPSDLEILARAKRDGLDRAIVVDVTAADGMEPTLDHALELGYSLVLANKKPLAGPWAAARHYFNHPRVRHESTVGGGQPVIATLRTLLDTNDAVHAITGQLSGSLGYIFTRLDAGVPFAQAVADARARGYTEPDPRDDLGGQDVMRKALILGRMAGWPLEPPTIQVESLYPPELAELSVEAFMTAVTQLDAPISQRVKQAAATGDLLRYVAEIGPEGGVVGLKKMPWDDPLAGLKFVAFHTTRYADEPLVIGGKGAGVEMTAAGVVGDLVALARELRD
jgi:homoserine dehydrogenase